MNKPYSTIYMKQYQQHYDFLFCNAYKLFYTYQSECRILFFELYKMYHTPHGYRISNKWKVFTNAV